MGSRRLLNFQEKSDLYLRLPSKLSPLPFSNVSEKILMESEAKKEIWSFTIQKLKVFDKIQTLELENLS